MSCSHRPSVCQLVAAKHLIRMDTKHERLEWATDLNIDLENALRPLQVECIAQSAGYTTNQYTAAVQVLLCHNLQHDVLDRKTLIACTQNLTYHVFTIFQNRMLGAATEIGPLKLKVFLELYFNTSTFCWKSFTVENKPCTPTIDFTVFSRNQDRAKPDLLPDTHVTHSIWKI